MKDLSVENRLETLDAFFEAQDGLAEVSPELLKLCLERYTTAEEVYGHHHPEALQRFCDYGFATLRAESYRAALELFLRLREQVSYALYSNHPLYIRSLIGCAQVFVRDDRLGEADTLIQEALVRNTRLHRREHGEAETDRMLAELLIVRAKFEALKELVLLGTRSTTLGFSQCVDLGKRFVSRCGLLEELDDAEKIAHQEILSLLLSRAWLLGEGKSELFSEAVSDMQSTAEDLNLPYLSETILRKKLEFLPSETDEDNSERIAGFIELAKLYAEAGQMEVARDFYLQATQCFDVKRGDSCCTSGMSRALGELAYLFGERRDSKILLRRSLEHDLNVTPESAETSELVHNLGTLALADGDIQEAEVYLTNALNMKRRYFGEMTAETQLTLMALGYLYGTSDRKERAEECFLAALQIEEDLNGTESDHYKHIQRERQKLVSADNGSNETTITEVDLEEPVSGFFRGTAAVSR